MTWLGRNIFAWRSLAFFLMAIIFWYVAFPTAYRLVVSPSRYMDVGTIYVPNAPVGASPIVMVDRHIRRRFTGEIVTLVRRIDEGEGTMWTFCDGQRVNMPYVAGRPYPGRDLNWWLGSPPEDKCDLPPGKYQLRIEWTILGFFGHIPLYEMRESQPFTIYDPLQANLYPVP